jgi:hypothetical protein
MKVSGIRMGICIVMSLLALASCKKESNEDNTIEGEPVETVGDTLSATETGGTGREVDSVDHIEAHLDSINNLPQ